MPPKKGKKKKKGTKKTLTDEEKAELEAKKLEQEAEKGKLPVYGWIKLTVSQSSFIYTLLIVPFSH